MTENELATIIVDASLEVHRELGPGLLESVYENCLLFELRNRGLHVLQQHPLPVIYKEVKMEMGFRLDLWVENKVVIEVKSVDALNDVHLAQVLTYLKLTNNKLGLLINFNVPLIKNGIRRVVNNL
ncbi:MAG: GxxExxY protein [Cyclobacteriaceae bacterium]|jgi:GxxExxY protein|nr:GxxExxY protein [Cyclobacteriaceae bacterium]